MHMLVCKKNGDIVKPTVFDFGVEIICPAIFTYTLICCNRVRVRTGSSAEGWTWFNPLKLSQASLKTLGALSSFNTQSLFQTFSLAEKYINLLNLLKTFNFKNTPDLTTEKLKNLHCVLQEGVHGHEERRCNHCTSVQTKLGA